MSNKLDRQNEIIRIIKEKNTLSIADLAGHFAVSEMTIRRDINELRKEKLVMQRRGRVYPETVDTAEEQYDLYKEKMSRADCKERISRFAASLIAPSDTIIMDAGSTTECLARCLPENKNLSVVCYNYNILEQVIGREDLNLVFLGGYYHPMDQMFESQYSVAFLEILRANKTFFSASGVHRTLGVTCGHNYEVIVKRSAFNSSDTKYLLVDSSKFDKVTGSYFAQLSELDAIITDDGISAEWKRYIEEELGLALYIV